MPQKKLFKIQNTLGCDPGRFNFGWCLYARSGGVQNSGVIEGLENVKFIPLYRKQVLRLFKTFRPDSVAIERFHSQPGRGSKTNLELVNLAIGILIEHCIKTRIPWTLVTASTHKRWLALNFKVGLMPVKKGKPRGRRKVIRKKFDITTYKEWKVLDTEHEVDAANIAKYALEKVFTE